MALEHSAAVALVATAATGAMVAVLPSLTDVRGGEPGESIGHDLHTGLFIGAGIVISLAAVAAFASRDPLPLIAAVIVIAAITAGYEWALRTRGAEGLI